MDKSIQTTSSNAALIPVFNGTIGGQAVQLCCARVLHGFMSVKRDFSTWIKGRIAKFGFVANEDFITVENLSSPDLVSAKSRAQKLVDYHLTLDMAKELSMVENNEQGRKARRYFIACERELLQQQQQAPRVAYSANPNDTLTKEEADTLRQMVEGTAKKLSANSKMQGKFIMQAWAKLKSHFKVGYRAIPRHELTEAISIITRHTVDWEVVDAAPTPLQMALPEEFIDVTELLLSGQTNPQPLTAAQHAQIDQAAGRLVGEAYPLIRAHLERRVAFNTNAAQQNDTATTQAILNQATLGNCLAHQYHTEVKAAKMLLQMVRLRLDAVLGSISQPLSLSH